MNEPQGFAVIPNWLIRDPAIGVNAKIVYALLTSHAGPEGVAWPSHATLAAEGGLGVSSVQRALRTLRDAGLVTWTARRRGDGGQTSNVYRVHIWPVTEPDGPPDTPTDRPDGPPSSQRQTPLVTVTDEEEPYEEEPLEEASLIVTSDKSRVRETTVTPVETEQPGPSEQPEPGATSRSTPPSTVPLGFEDFWEAFPRKEKQTVTEARWKWAITQAPPEQIIEGARGYARLCKQEEREQRFITSPSKWLEERRWTDEYPKPKTKGWLDDLRANGLL